jgi:hypothetical protein
MNKYLVATIIPFIHGSCSRTAEISDAYTFVISDYEPDTVKYDPVPPVESFANTKLRIELEQIYNSDQAIRNEYIALEKKYGHDSKEAKSLENRWRDIDTANRNKVMRILDKYGWLGPYEIGDQANRALWLVIQHSDIHTQDKYLPKMRKAVKVNKANISELALLEDRVLIGHGKKQLFGSQLQMDTVTQKYKFAPIEDEVNVNKRRASVGLEPLEKYAKNWGINYVLPSR